MDSKRLQKFIKFHWIKILLFSVAALVLIALISLIVIGIGHFMELESFYKRMTLAGIPLQIFLGIVTAFIFASIYMGFHYWFMFGGGFAKLGQKKTKPSDVNVKWSDVVGMESIKSEVSEVVNLIKDRVHLKRVGGKIIKGLLMVGPPGCGKTYLAKAIATETGMPFLSAVGSEFMGIFVGVGSSKIRTLFKEARMLAEMHGGCIVFIDEIDTIARPRVGVSGMGAGMDYNATVNQLLTEMDGLRQTENNVVVIAATNVPEHQLDEALMRAGRFDRKIYVSLPGLDDRKKLFQYYLRKVRVDPLIDVDVLARRALGFSPADIANMVREASLVSVRNKRNQIAYKDLSEAYDRVVFGLKTPIVLSEKEKESTAYHESGHAIIAYLTHPTNDIVKATIIPRKGTLGMVAQRPQEETHTKTKEWFLANIKCSLGGYVAEKIRYGTTTSGVSADFQNALSLAHAMVFSYGMGESGILGNYQALATNWNYQLSEDTKKKMEADVQKILTDCITEVENILTTERELLDHFAKQLIEKGELEYDEIVEIFKKYGKERPQEKYL